MSTTALMTVEQFAHMQTADTEDYELVEGELVPLSSGTPLHARIRGLLEHLIRGYLAGNVAGEVFAETDCRLSAYTVRRPDLSIFLGARIRDIDLNQIPIPFAPDIAVEVLSPSESAIDVNRKTLEYLAAGSSEVWLLDSTNGEILVRSTAGIRVLREDDSFESALLPGFSCKVSELLG